MTLPAFAAERRATAPLLLSAAAGDCYRAGRGAQHQTRRTPLLLSATGQTDGRQTDGLSAVT